MPAETWTPAHTAATALPKRPLWSAMRRGLAGRCPNCGEGHLFGGYLKVVDRCERCGEDYSHARADDLPPYLTIIVVGHIVIPLVLLVEQTWSPPDWVQFALWVPLTLIMTLALLQPIKGAVVGLQWANYMHGFHPAGPEDGDPTYRDREQGEARGG